MVDRQIKYSTVLRRTTVIAIIAIFNNSLHDQIVFYAEKIKQSISIPFNMI